MSRAEKYIDLVPTIESDLGGGPIPYIGEILNWLDSHPDQVPRRTITAGEVGRWSHLINGRCIETPTIIDFLEALGITVTPDPAPTNAEKLNEIMKAWPGHPTSGEYLDSLGVKAPGGDDE